LSGTWANAGAVLLANVQGALAAAHIFVAQLIDGQLVNVNVTGFAANGGAQVPDGGMTVMLLGMALGALGVVRRYLISSGDFSSKASRSS
jgi:VPDSG-CTERM motif